MTIHRTPLSLSFIYAISVAFFSILPNIALSQSAETVTRDADPPVPIEQAALGSSDSVAGSPVELQVSFLTPDIPFPDDYRVGVTFPAEFDFSGEISAVFTDNSPAPDPDLREIQILDHTVVFRFRRTFFAPRSDQTGIITISGPRLPERAGVYAATVFITDTNFTALAGPTFTNEITVEPGALVSLTIRPDTALALVAGEERMFTVDQLDQYGNDVVNTELLWELDASRDRIGVVEPGRFLATTVGSGRLVVQASGVVDTSAEIRVAVGELAELRLRLPPVATIGGGMCDSAYLIGLDAYGNRFKEFDLVENPVIMTSSYGFVSPRVISDAVVTDGVIDLAGAGLTLPRENPPSLIQVVASYDGLKSNVAIVRALGFVAEEIDPEYRLVSLPVNTIVYPEIHLRQFSPRTGSIDSLRISFNQGASLLLGDGLAAGADYIASSDEYLLTRSLPGGDTVSFEFFGAYGDYSGRDTVCQVDQLYGFTLEILDREPAFSLAVDTVLMGVSGERYTGFGFNSYFAPYRLRAARAQRPDGVGGWRDIGSVDVPDSGLSSVTAFLDSLVLLVDDDTVFDASTYTTDLRMIIDVGVGLFRYSDTVLGFDQITYAAPTRFDLQESEAQFARAGDLVVVTNVIELAGPLSESVVVDSAHLSLKSGAQIISLSVAVDQVAAELSLSSEPLTVDESMTGLDWRGSYELFYSELGIRRSSVIDSPQVVLSVAEATQIAIVTAQGISPNYPHLTLGQDFSVAVAVRNNSPLTIGAVSLIAMSAGPSNIADTVVVGTLNGLSEELVRFDLRAGSVGGAVEELLIQVFSDAGEVKQDEVIEELLLESPPEITLSATVNPSVPSGDALAVLRGSPLSLDLTLINSGEAQIEAPEVNIELIGAGMDFTTTAEIGPTGARVALPGAERTGVMTLSAQLDAVTDRNTGLPVSISGAGGRAKLELIVRDALASARLEVVAPASALVTPENGSELLELRLFNESLDQDASLDLNRLTVAFSSLDGDALRPVDVLSISSLRVVSSGAEIRFDRSAFEESLKLRFSDLSVAPGEELRLTLRGASSTDATVGAFRVAVPLEGVALTVNGGLQHGSVITPERISGAPTLESSEFILAGAGFADSFRPENNPFNPNVAENRYSYTLASDAEVELTIYTLTGELVRNQLFAAGSTGGVAGPQMISWDGRNGSGAIVRDGVYLLVLTNNDSGERVTLRQAVVK